MSTATAARDRRRSTPAARARRRRPRRRLAPVWWLAGGLVTVAFVVAVIVGGGSDDSTTDVEQTRTVHISGTALPAYSVDGADAAVGLAIPAVEGSSFDGSPVSLADTGPKVLVFAAHWCPHCQRRRRIERRHRVRSDRIPILRRRRRRGTRGGPSLGRTVGRGIRRPHDPGPRRRLIPPSGANVITLMCGCIVVSACHIRRVWFVTVMTERDEEV